MRRIIDADKLREIAVHEEVCRRLAEKRHQREIIDAEENIHS